MTNLTPQEAEHINRYFAQQLGVCNFKEKRDGPVALRVLRSIQR
jgi:hypothetical protein